MWPLALPRMEKLNNSELPQLWKIGFVNLFSTRSSCFQGWSWCSCTECTSYKVCGSKQQALCFIHRVQAFQFAFKEQASFHQSVFLVVHLLGRKRHMGLLWGKADSSWQDQVLQPQNTNSISCETWRRGEEQKVCAQLHPCLKWSVGRSKGRRGKLMSAVSKSIKLSW